MADGEDGERREVFRGGGRGGGGCGLPREARQERFVFREIEGERGAWAGGGCGGGPVERDEVGDRVVGDANFAVGREAAEIDRDGGAGERSEWCGEHYGCADGCAERDHGKGITGGVSVGVFLKMRPWWSKSRGAITSDHEQALVGFGWSRGRRRLSRRRSL